MVVLDSRAVVLEKLGRFKEALQDARAVIELTPTSPKVSNGYQHISSNSPSRSAPLSGVASIQGGKGGSSSHAFFLFCVSQAFLLFESR